ncbi:MAG: efflux RND transporter periplasmic adaptor subunit [Clostridiales bacterium]|nr:efflux RND transporter periplasmic adaptor subunit [Clostridiales bacterium]
MRQKDRFRIKRITGLLVMVSVLVMIAGCSLFPKEEEVIAPPVVKPKPPTYNLHEVKRGDIIRAVNGTATFQSSKEYSLFYKTDGRLKEINVKVGDSVKKGDILVSLDAEDLETAIKQQEFALEKIKLTINHFKNQERKILKQDPNADTSDLKYQINLNQIERKSIEYTLNKLKERMNNTKLVSPIDGRVVFVADLSEGDVVRPYQKIVTVADPNNLELVMEYKQNSPTAIVTGMKAEIEINDEIYAGEVIGTPADIPEGTDDRYKNLLILSIEEQPEGIKVGDMASVSIIIQKKDNVIKIPKQAVREYLGRKYVQILEGEVKKEVDIEVGIESATEVEVIKGLEEGQQVILR